MPLRRVLGIFVFSLCFLFVWASSDPLTVEIEARSKECFFVEVPKRKQIDFTWQVLRGGILDIRVLVEYRAGMPTVKPNSSMYAIIQNGVEPGSFSTKRNTPPGNYALCFDNEYSKTVAKLVQFTITAYDADNADDDDDATTPSDFLEPMEISARALEHQLDSFQYHQKYRKDRDLVHAKTQESTVSRIFWLSVCESILMISLSLLQVHYIRKFFTNKRVV